MIEFLVVPGVALISYRFGAQMYIRRLTRKRNLDEAARVESLRWWAENTLSPVKVEARVYWAEAMRPHSASVALDVLRPAMEQGGRNSIPALLLAARWALHDNWLDHADRHYAKALESLTKASDGLLKARIYALRAEVALKAGRLDETLAHLDAALLQNPYDADTRLLRAGFAFSRGDVTKASVDFDFLETTFGNAALRTRAAIGGSQVDILQGNFEKALAKLDKVLAAKPESQSVLRRRRAVVQAFAGDAQSAAENLKGLEGSEAATAYPLGVIAAAREDWDAARRHLAAALMRTQVTDPGNAEVMWVLIGVLKAVGQTAQAQDMTDRLAGLFPNSPYLKLPLQSGLRRR